MEESLEDKKKGINVLSTENSSTEEESVIESFTNENGDKYVGQMKDDYPHGQGKYTFAESELFKEYEGEWKEGRRHGKGKMLFVDNPYKTETVKFLGEHFFLHEFDLYEGDWEDDKFHGKGYYTATF